jgi:NAD(P)-dependent dehydrogenase (short-subunit alcohol dehydrogenase family)
VTKPPVSNTSSNEQNSQLQTPLFFPADVTNEQQIQDMFNKIKQQYGRLDAVLNCAGIGVAFRTYNINKVRINLFKKQTFFSYFFEFSVQCMDLMNLNVFLM